MSEKLIVIGGTAAGLSAASKAKRLNKSLSITVYEKSGYISYGACGLPYFVGDIIREADELISLTVDEVTNERGIPTHIHHEVLAIDRENKLVLVKNLTTGETFTDPYDKLVIATGAQPIPLNIPGGEAENVHFLRTVEDGIRLKQAVAKKGLRAAIVGGGFIGLETAEELTQAGVQVELFEALPRLCPFLPEAFSQEVLETLTANGVNVHLGTSVAAIETDGNKAVAVTDSNGEKYPVDLILCSIGVRPATALAEACGLELGLKKGIVVDEHQRTSDPDIFACGDCVEMKHLITGAPVHIPLGTTANKQGRIAGENLGGQDSCFAGVLGSMVTKVFDKYIAATGLTLAQAEAAGFAAAESTITQRDKASYYPGAKPAKLHLVFEKGTGRLLGAQGLGGESISGRINVLVAAITAKMTVFDLNELDLVYAPPVSPVYDPILIAASQAIKKV